MQTGTPCVNLPATKIEIGEPHETRLKCYTTVISMGRDTDGAPASTYLPKE